MMQEQGAVGFRLEPFPNIEQQQVDWLELMCRQHTVHALLEADVTETRQSIRRFRSETGEPLSLTAFVIGCVAQAVGEDRRMHAYRRGRGRLVIFDDVDVTVPVERVVEGKRVPVPCIVRAANGKRLVEIQAEIQAAQVEDAPQAPVLRWLPLWLLLPSLLRRCIWAGFLRNPYRRKKMMGTVFVTAVGMFGRGSGWGIPLTVYTLGLTVGGIARKPGVVRAGKGRREERIEVREYLALTLSIDHDVVNGAPAARFAARLKELIENGVGPDEGLSKRDSP
jgi:pyruvate/2-oxoglutarate dehydrogenase complex dihydrolipoamide acyltransferase (E2) component